jgi:hypothetical protein
MAKARNASNEFPHPYPSVLYIFGAASGKAKAIKQRTMTLAANADAAYLVKASTVYAWMEFYSELAIDPRSKYR